MESKQHLLGKNGCNDETGRAVTTVKITFGINETGE